MKANTPTNNLIVNEAKILLKRLLAKQEKWINTYLIPVESSTANMTAQQCVKWLNDTQTVPAYLDAACISRYHRACEKVEQTLHGCRIQGVLSMFRELTYAEQEEFIRLITK